CQHGYGVLFTF
nr:immunoglobulin light chain junction region [Macaca mulatta]MOX85961.1 immunoglobulin light chain junction region [Macaca mulatta]MOX86506.1 immunoglobulin light chain junction region [Macaca mulatta]MOX86621.1 immunoglobulin light chain junction region [Macaca mulatta]MOX89204.1 immunoglobulin light chain junction region [Macaca mulatta]